MRRLTTKGDAYHWETPTAPSIQEDELKNMPWWWRDEGESMELVAWTRRVSLVDTSMGGGLGAAVSDGVRKEEEPIHTARCR